MNVGAGATASTRRSKGSSVKPALSFSLCVHSGIDLKLSSLCLGKHLPDELSPQPWSRYFLKWKFRYRKGKEIQVLVRYYC